MGLKAHGTIVYASDWLITAPVDVPRLYFLPSRATGLERHCRPQGSRGHCVDTPWRLDLAHKRLNWPTVRLVRGAANSEN